MGKVAPYLNIEATSPGNPNAQAVRVAQAQAPIVYLATNDAGSNNGGLVADGGFSDLSTKDLRKAHEYTFTFDNSVTVSNFTLHMLDYGDLNQVLSTSHLVTLTAYDVNGNKITTPGASQELSYTSPADRGPRSSDKYGDLRFSGDAVSASVGQPGNWTWNISGTGIHRIVLAFPQGYDPNIAFNRLSYSVECASLP
jgi:hypothetical protein